MLAEASTSDEERRILALAAASLGAVSEEQVLSFGGSADALASLVLRGMLARTGADFVTARAPTTTALPPGLIREAHVYLARISASAEERIFHVASGGDHAGARALLPAMSPLVSAPPPALYDLARRLALVEDGRLRAFAAEVLERAGDTRASTRALLALVLRRHDVQRERARLVLGRLLTRRGDLRALRVLRACALPEARVEETIALLKLGRFGEAVALAERAMAEPNASPFRTDLEISQALGRSFAGEIDGQFPQIRAACESPPAAPRTRFRLWNAAATIALRAGKNHEARSFYVRALGEARTHGLSDLTLSATVNLAVADHQAKELGAALHGYRRAQDLARASNNDATLAMVTLYRARLFADLRSWKRAAFEVDQLSGRTLSPVHQASRSYIEAELGLARGDHASARRLAEDAIRQCAHAPRERAEAGVLRLAVEIAAGEDDAHALRLADALDDESRLLGAEDVSARLHCLRTELSMRRGRDDEAARHARTALLHADRSERRSLQAEAHALLARVYEKSGALAAARPHTEAATRLEEEHWSELPVELRPPRPPGAIRSAHDAGSRDGQALARALLKVFAAHDSGDAHARAVEEAISLTRAERGFLLLRGESSPVVAAAKNVDQEAIKKPRQKYGRSIAQKVMEHGESILMVDAQTDANVPQGTAHRLGLRSVLCVPLFTKARATGALYLDNRFADGAFTEADERAVRTLAEALASLLIRFDAEDALAAEVVELRRLPRPVPAPVSPALPTSGHAMVSPFPEITTRSQALLGALEPVARVADVDVPVLIRGESGTGKELVARAIHAHGARRAGPFVAINCGALPETLLEAELFGYVRGAFTGANQDKDGLFVAAQKGTLFLDELGEMPLSMQVKLLRVLQEREVRPVGGTKQVPLDVRVVCATNRDLRKEIAEGRFREDLYYRVAVVDVLLPPLRERAMDVPYLADAFMQRLVRETGLSKRLAPEAVSALLRHDWPGNVRELENAIVRAFFLADGVVVSEVPGLGKEGTEQKRRPRKGDEERRALASALEENEWNVRQVARMLGIPRATFYRKLARYGLARTPP
jgi:transcriptional regulator with GAF, ATPase, and Fis domain/tetratricopeptide (TPR) repeat protein